MVEVNDRLMPGGVENLKVEDWSVLIDTTFKRSRVPQNRYPHIPHILVDGEGAVREAYYFREPIFNTQRPEYKGKYPRGVHLVAGSVVNSPTGAWLLSPEVLGEGGIVDAYYAFNPKKDLAAVARIPRSLSDNTIMSTEKTVVQRLRGRPEVVRQIDDLKLPDGRRVNIHTLMQNNFRMSHVAMGKVDSLRSIDLLALTLLQHCAHSEWNNRGVAYCDWQEEEACVRLGDDPNGLIESFVAIDFGQGIVNMGDEVRWNEAKKRAWEMFARRRVIPLVGAALKKRILHNANEFETPKDIGKKLVYFGLPEEMTSDVQCALIESGDSQMSSIVSLINFAEEQIMKERGTPDEVISIENTGQVLRARTLFS